MATTPIVAVLPPGQTGLKLELYPADSDSIANGAGGDALSESTNRKSRYEADVDAAISGDHYAVVKTSGGSTLASGWIKSLKDTTETQYVMPTLEHRIVASRDTLPDGSVTAGALTSGAKSDIASAVGNEVQTIAVVLPSTAVVADRTDRTNLKLYVGETISVSINVYESDGTTPIDLSAKTLIAVVEDETGADVATVEGGSITVSGDNSNVVTFAVPSAVTARPRALPFSVRDASSPETVYVDGLFRVTKAPRKDA